MAFIICIHRKDVIEVPVNTRLTVTHINTHNAHCGVTDMSLPKWHKLNPISLRAIAQLLAVTEDPRHWAVASGYASWLDSGLLSLGAIDCVSNSPAGEAHHTSRPPLSNRLEWSHWVMAPAVATPRLETLASVLRMVRALSYYRCHSSRGNQ